MTQNITPSRIASIDILRALTMVLMIFVNDLWSLQNIPEWLEHTAADEDGMGLADVVFPAFLFIVGMSIPFAINNRRKKGDSDLQIAGHVIMRSIALLVMGLFLVNGENLNGEATGMQRVVFYSLACFSFILLWNAYPSTANRWLVWGAKATGIVVLLILAFICRAGKGDNIHGFATYWWGILGLIGWSYLVCGLVYTFLHKRMAGIIAVWIFFHVLCAISTAKMIPKGFLRTILDPIGGGAMPALTMGGVVISMIYLYYRNLNRQPKMLLIYTGIAIVMLLVGFYTNSFWIISKIRATPPWILICSAITILSFVIIYWIADMKGKAHWFNFIKPAGTNTLLCYLLPYFAYTILELLNIEFPGVILTGGIGLIKSLVFALLIVQIAGLLGKVGVQLKL